MKHWNIVLEGARLWIIAAWAMFFSPCTAPKKISYELCTNLNLLKSQHIVLLLLHKWKRISYGHQFAKIAKSIYQLRSRVILRKHSILFAKNARNPYPAKLVWQCIAKHCQYNTLSNPLGHTKRDRCRAFSASRVRCFFRKTLKLRLQYTQLLFWDTTLPYYNRMFLSKNGQSFIPILHEKSRTKIVTAPQTSYEFRESFFSEW